MAPWVGKYLPSQGFFPQYVPLCLFGGFGILSGVCALQLPETLGHHLPSTFDDVEEMKWNSKQCWQKIWRTRAAQESEMLLK